MAKHSPAVRNVVSRVAASLLGGYAFCWGFAALGLVLLLAVGMPFGDARDLVMLLVFLVFLGTICWAFAATSLVRVWAVLGGGGAAMTGAAWLLSRGLI